MVASGSRDLIRAWLDRKFTQWDVIKPYLLASYQAAYEPDVVATTERWFEGAVGEMMAGLDQAGRFPPGPATDPMRARLRRAGVPVPALLRGRLAHAARTSACEELTDSWCYLLVDDE